MGQKPNQPINPDPNNPNPNPQPQPTPASEPKPISDKQIEDYKRSQGQ